MITPDRIKSLAQSLGFDACGIVSLDRNAKPLQEDLERLKEWIAQGFHGTMKYMEDFESRAEKFWENFPEAKSMIVVGVNYYSHAPLGSMSRNDELVGRAARYAWGKDYHRVIGKRLEEFRDKISEITGRKIRVEICVDTKPLPERSLAQKAGLGFIGKQSQLLSPKFGPWLFLAELVTDLELEADMPFVGSCGACRICIDACPTEAIREGGEIDARRCISYLTIENKKEISESLKPLLGDHVFGCDICLDVCPYASKGKDTKWNELRPESGKGVSLDLLKILEIPSNRLYEKEFDGTAILRANRRQLIRNARIVLANH